MPSSDPGTVPSIFSITHLAEVDVRRTAHLRWCRWCRAGCEPVTWARQRIEGTDLVRCPDCGALDPPFASIAEVDAFHEEQRRRAELTHTFVCSVCGNPYGTPVQPTPPLPQEDSRAREERCRRYAEPWTHRCDTCGEPTQPVRATEREPFRLGSAAPTPTIA